MSAIEQHNHTDQRANISWRDGTVPVSVLYDDPYFSLEDGLAETRHVFLAGNDLPDRLKPGFSIAELGFGTGLNLLTLVALTPPDCPISFTSFEAHPMTGQQITQALSAIAPTPLWADRIELVADLVERRATSTQIGSVAVSLIWGDAATTLPNWDGSADAWFLDGFSPAKNPDMWSPSLMAEVGQHTSSGGTFATFTAAGSVRRALANAGFEVSRGKGFGRKRHMSRGVKP